MDFETARSLYNRIETTKILGPKRELIIAAVRYARLRAEWQLADLQAQWEMDRHRAAAHDALIDACNILSRNMAKSGEDTSWRASLNDRKEIGDFACYVHCFLGLAAR
jgi:hypothetical protein